MKKLLSTIILVTLILSSVACGGSKKVDLHISAAASVQDAILELKELYEEENKHINIIPNFGPSGGLMQQIQEGVDADLFISAGKKEVDQLEEKGLLVDESRIDLLKNDLVLIVNEKNKDKVKSLSDLLTLEGIEIAIGQPESVPAGRYALEALQSLGLYERLEAHMVFTKDVRQVLDYVDTENIIAGENVNNFVL